MRVPVVLAVPALSLALAAAATAQGQLDLGPGWRVQASSRIQAAGETISRAGFAAEGWYEAAVPTTVFAALVALKVYPDPYVGRNLRSVPGVSYPVGENFSKLAMPRDSPFRTSWWYRREFALPAEAAGHTLWLAFDGINYRANVWLNGSLVAGAADVAGAFRRYEFDVTSFLHPSGENALAVEVFAPQPDDLGITWVDWNPAPPDKDMGLWGGARLSWTGPVALRHPQVSSDLELPSLASARLTVAVELRNTTDRPQEGELRGALEGARFARPFALGPREARLFRWTAADLPELALASPRVWWPYDLGRPELYDLELEAAAGGSVSDRARVRFGVRSVTSEKTDQGHCLFRVNGQKVLVRGGGWSPDMMLRRSAGRLETEFRYVKQMHLNTIRLEGKLEGEDFFDLADREGILVMAGWCCCDHWEQWGKWKPENRRVAEASLRDQARRLRNHPSVLVWLNGSDNPPPAPIETMYLDVLKEARWPLPTLSSATAAKTTVTGASGVKMTGPYDWVPPNYWLEDKKAGGAFGFNTETSPGPAVPPVETLKAMLGPDHLWPMDATWDFHAGGNVFKSLKIYTTALEARYGKAQGVDDYAWKSQAVSYEGERAMFEAFRRNKYTATGVVQWMLNNAWPSLIWHLYDYYLRPGAGFYAVRRACEPLHVQYSYDDRSVVVVSDGREAHPGLKVHARVYGETLAERSHQEAVVDVPADGVVRALQLPAPGPGLSFVRLSLEDASGGALSRNFYWLPASPDVLDWKGADWYHTPVRRYADLTALARLPRVHLEHSVEFSGVGSEGQAKVRVRNPSESLALLVHVRLGRGPDGPEILPTLWDDNYFELMPGEARDVTGSYPSSLLGGAAPVVTVDGWNVTG